MALASTVVVFAALALIIVNSPGWPKVKHAFFDPAEFRAYFATIGHAFVLNIKIFLVAEVLILILALVLAVLRSLPGPVFFPIRLLAIGYTDLFRGIPTILLVYLLGFGIPALQLSACHARSRLSGRGGAGARVHGVRGGGVPRRHRVGAPQPGGGGPVAGPDALADDARRDPAAGGAARDSAAPERLHRAAEGHGADLGAGPVEALQRAQTWARQRVQLHALRGGGASSSC